MNKILNMIFMVLKIVLLLFSFTFSLYIVFCMYHRIDRDIIYALPIFIPYIVILLLFFININLKNKYVNDNIFYNLSCCLVFFCISIVDFRSIFDKNMLLNEIMGYGINFTYFSNFLPFMTIMIYGLCCANICFMVYEKFDLMSVE